jgi:hypothetical protein
MAAHRQVVFVTFHMAAMPLVAAFLASACTEMHSRPGHVFIGAPNIGWLGAQSSQWIFDASETIFGDPPGLRRLLSGLKLGTITRLLILLDGPHLAGRPGTRALANVAPSLAFKTGLLFRILDMGIPIRPLTHHWESEALSLKWHPYLNFPRRSDGIRAQEHATSAVTSLIEDLLRRHPEQWLNWSAAGLRE